MEDIVLIYTVTLDPSESVVGKGINISLVLKKLGIESIATGIVNHKNVEQVAEELDKAEIENQFIAQNLCQGSCQFSIILMTFDSNPVIPL